GDVQALPRDAPRLVRQQVLGLLTQHLADLGVHVQTSWQAARRASAVPARSTGDASVFSPERRPAPASRPLRPWYPRWLSVHDLGYGSRERSRQGSRTAWPRRRSPSRRATAARRPRPATPRTPPPEARTPRL